MLNKTVCTTMLRRWQHIRDAILYWRCIFNWFGLGVVVYLSALNFRLSFCSFCFLSQHSLLFRIPKPFCLLPLKISTQLRVNVSFYICFLQFWIYTKKKFFFLLLLLFSIENIANATMNSHQSLESVFIIFLFIEWDKLCVGWQKVCIIIIYCGYMSHICMFSPVLCIVCHWRS